MFDIWLWHGDLYRVSPFQAYGTSTSCLPCDLEFFMFAAVSLERGDTVQVTMPKPYIKYKIISSCRSWDTSYENFHYGKHEKIWYMALARWLVPCFPFPGLPHIYFLFTARLRIFHVCVMKTVVTDISASTGRNDFIFDMWLWHGDLYRQ
jgi:hypothetical protein